MISVFWLVFWVGLTLLAFAAGLSLRMRLRDAVRPPAPELDDDAIETIIRTGTLTTPEDEPLDLREIAEEERRFWSEPWDEPEEW